MYIVLLDDDWIHQNPDLQEVDLGIHQIDQTNPGPRGVTDWIFEVIDHQRFCLAVVKYGIRFKEQQHHAS